MPQPPRHSFGPLARGAQRKVKNLRDLHTSEGLRLDARAEW